MLNYIKLYYYIILNINLDYSTYEQIRTGLYFVDYEL